MATTTVWQDNFEPVANDWWNWETTTLTGDTASWNMLSGDEAVTSIIAPHSGYNMAVFNSYDAEAGWQARLAYFAPVSIPSVTPATLSFWMYHEGSYPGNPDILQAQVSTDAGVTWINVGPSVPRYTGGHGWARIFVDISAFAGKSVKIGFLGTSGYGSDICIDDVAVFTGIADPAIVPPPSLHLYQTYQRQTRPPWLLQAAGGAWSDGTATVKDDLRDDLIAAVKLRMPMLAPWDALDKLGSERQVYRGPADTDAQYAARLRTAWHFWARAGTPWGILRGLWDLGYRGMHLISVNGTDSTLDSSGNLVQVQVPNWSIWSSLDFWSAYQIFFPYPWASGQWSEGLPGAATAEVTRLKRLVIDTAPSFARFGGIAVQQTSGQLWGWPIPRRTWGAGGKWGAGGFSAIWI